MKNSFFIPERRSKQNRYFSEEFKKKKVKDLENNLITVTELSRTYHVTRSSIYKWIYKYSIMTKKQHRQVVEPKSDTKKIQLLEERIKELEQAVGQKQMMIDFKEKMIEIAEETYNIDIKKKFASKPSSGTNSTKKNTGTK